MELGNLRTNRTDDVVTLWAGTNAIRFSTTDDHSRRWFAGNCAAGRAHARAVESFEANACVIPLLERNVALNCFEAKVTVHHVAVADEQGFTSFSDRSSRPGEMVGGGSARVPMICLDDHFHRAAGTPDVFKIDVEGSEARVLRGMVGILERGRPMLLLEIHPEKLASLGSSERDVVEVLDRFGNSCESIGKQGRNRIVWATAPTLEHTR